MKRILLLSFAFLTVIAFSAMAQRTVSGKVTDDTGEALPGVNVVIKGTTTGVTTDLDGNYRLSVDDGATLVFSYVGFETQEIQVGARSTIDVTLGGATELQEVVVTGYSSTTKERSSISSATVTNKDIANRPNPSFVQTLSGQVAGVNIVTNSGQPGANSTFQIRGVSSINGDTEPLFVIDGAPVDADNFRSINPNDIESVSVLKDAGATAIYGNRGANGVVLITTRSGSYNSPLDIQYTYRVGKSSLQDNDYDLMNAREQLEFERSSIGLGVGATPIYYQNRPNTPYGPINGLASPITDAQIDSMVARVDGGTSWEDWFFSQGTAQQHNLSLTRGTENMRMALSFGYLNQEGILQSSSLERGNIRTNISGRSDNQKFTYSVNTSVNYSTNEEPNSIGGSGINRNYVLGAYQSVQYISPNDYSNGADLLSPLAFANTPLFLIDRLETYTRVEDEVKLIGTISAGYEIIEGLSVNYRVSGDFQEETLTRAEGPTSFNALLFAQTGNTTPGFQQQMFTREFRFNQVASINYSKSFDVHTVTAGAYAEEFRARYDHFRFFSEGLDPKTFFPGDGSAFVPDNASNDWFVDPIAANILKAGLFSYFGTLDYDYDSKYGAAFVVRRDASFRFAESNRWGTFWSASARWNIHNEAFASNLPFDVLKLRASYGVTGNQNVNVFDTEFNESSVFSAPDLTRALFATGAGYGGQNSLQLSQIPNNALRWEEVAQWNIGLDAEAFNNKLRVKFDVYNKLTSGLFQSVPVSAINSVTSLNSNFGEMKNSGFDWEVAYDILRDPNGANLTVRTVGNYNKIELLEFPGGLQEQVGTGRIGGPLNEQFRYRYAGVNPANGNLLFLTADGEVTENPDADTDRVWLGRNIYPDYIGSFSVDFDYKGFFVQVQMNYTLGVDRLDFDYSGFVNPDNIGQFRHSRDMLRAWTPENRFTDIPRLNAPNRSLGGASDRFLRNADYLRLRFATVGYDFPKAMLDQTNFFKSARVFVNGENLFTITEWRGFDAEAQSNTSRLYPTPRTVSLGVELGF
ncbi:SusC/RagA family TonB-linked outer membrane protein [Ekhidna sp.]|uniref:SusC/RagA family TonB-linked outer membrane protein n=1 Tax=Ekhidna sp. TaxID=2608089 RepID=UPI003CCBC607